MGKKNADGMLFWTVDEFKKFIAAISDKPTTALMFRLLFWTGMRSGEMLALNLTDFNFEENTVSISKNYARHKNEDLIMDPKTPKSKRVITLPPSLSAAIEDYAKRLVDYEPTDRLFTLTKNHLRREMERGCRLSGVKRIRIHDLRHSHVSLLIHMGYSAVAIANRIGHKSIDITFRYAHMFPSVQSQMVDALDALKGADPFDICR